MPREPRPPRGSDDSSETASQALERARGHARRALGEALAAAHALLDAAAIGWTGRPSEAHAALRGIADLLAEHSARLREGAGGVPAPMMNAIVEALDEEIARWQRRAASDPNARAVLRTFLGLREILWEFGLRGDTARDSSATPPPRRKPIQTRRRKPGSGPRRPGRVHRVDVQG